LLAHCYIQVGAAVGVNDPGDILWCATEWSAGGVDVRPVKVAKWAAEGRKQRTSALSGKTVIPDLQRVALSGNEDEVDVAEDLMSVSGGRQVAGEVPLKPEEKKKEKRRKQNHTKRANQKRSPSQKNSHMPQPGGDHNKKRTTTLLERLSSL